jgi:NDP-sugar pyrophosphorylase family protein
MRHIDYGISVLTSAVFTGFPDNAPFDLADLYSRLVSEKQTAAFEVKQRFYEIGSAQGLAELDALLRNNTVSLRA